MHKMRTFGMYYDGILQSAISFIILDDVGISCLKGYWFYPLKWKFKTIVQILSDTGCSGLPHSDFKAGRFSLRWSDDYYKLIF